MVAAAGSLKKARTGTEDGPALRLFTVDEFERMIAAGIVREGERVELVDGEILCMAALGSRHAACLGRLLDWCIAQLPRTVAIRVQDPIRLRPRSELQPDLVIARWRADRYQSGHPEPADVLLVFEVSDTTFAYDRHRKLPRYAAAGIPDVCIWDLPHQRVLVCRRPENRRYTEITEVKRGGQIAPLAFPDVSIPVDEILG